MKIVTVYRFDGNDPNWVTQIDEAFNRVMNFAPELRVEHGLTEKQRKEARTPQLLAIRRLSDGEFSFDDVTTLNSYAGLIHDRITERYGLNVKVTGTPDYVAHHRLVGGACRQDANNLVMVMADFSTWFQAMIKAIPNA